MTNNWISRVTGQPVTESVPVSARKVSSLKAVLGEAEDAEEKKDKPEATEKPEKKEADIPPAPATDKPDEGDEAESDAAVDADIEAGADASADTSIDSQTVEHLVSSWESGSKMDVASQLMYTPVSYVDFVKMLFRIGEESGVELGGMLDQLSQVQPSIDQPGGGNGGAAGAEGAVPQAPSKSSDRILSRIAQRRQRDLPVAEPAGETTPELDSAP